MKNSLLNKILLVVVVAIWILVIYRYFFSQGEAPVEQLQTNNKVAIKQPLKKEKDFEVKILSRDPFLGKILKKKTSIKTIKKVKTPSKKKTVLNEVWPNIKYIGFIKKEKSNKVALLNVSGTFTRLKENEKKEAVNFYVKKIYKDSIIVKKGKSTKVIRK